jgi:hypothetical protein
MTDSALVLQGPNAPSPPARLAVPEVPTMSCTGIVLALTAWLCIGVLTARLFGAFVEYDDDDQETMRN